MKKITMTLLLLTITTRADAIYFEVDSTWAQPNGLGSAISLTYSYSNLLDSSMLDFYTGKPIPASSLRGAFEAALWDYASILPIHFVEITDSGPAPETGEYNPAGMADIRIGQVANIDNANAYAYFPFHASSGLAGDIVFNQSRFGNDWTLSIFYGVAQHELGHSLGMGHAISGETPSTKNENSTFTTDYTGSLFPLGMEMIVALQNTYGAGTGSVTPVPLPSAFLLLLTSMGILSYFKYNHKVNNNEFI